MEVTTKAMDRFTTLAWLVICRLQILVPTPHRLVGELDIRPMLLTELLEKRFLAFVFFSFILYHEFVNGINKT